MTHFPLVFLTGGAVLILEILGTRIIAPFFGSTIYVWSSLITVTLASLAGGYAVGGVYADRPRPLRTLGSVLALSSLWLFLLPAFTQWILSMAVNFGVQGGALLGASVLFGPPLFLLGCVGPLCIRLRTKQLGHLGREVGAITAISTAGSVCGALLTGFYLIPKVSTGKLLAGLALVLCVLAVASLRRARAETRMGVLLLAALVAGGIGWAASAEPGDLAGSLRAREHTFYGDVKVVDFAKLERRSLFIDGIMNTAVKLGSLESVSDYILAFELLPMLRPSARQALLIGLGGGTLVRRYQEHYGISTDVLEIDPVIERIARRWFGFQPSGKVEITDGRRYLEAGDSLYDLIVLDAFNGDQHPYHLFSLEAFEAAARRLGPEGVFALNIIGYAHGPEGELRRSIERTLGQVFPELQVLVANRGIDPREAFANLIFIASRQPLEFRRNVAKARPELAAYFAEVKGNYLAPSDPELGGVLLTDDYNPIESLSAPAFLAIRQKIFENIQDVVAHGL